MNGWASYIGGLRDRLVHLRTCAERLDEILTREVHLECLENLVRQVESTHRTFVLDRAAPLWQALKSAQEAHPKHQLLLVFDQFEELSTYPPGAIRAFASQLAQALYQQVPQAFRKLLTPSTFR